MKRSTLFFLAISMMACTANNPTADVIFRGGKIYTSNEARPEVEAVAVIGDTIAYAGDLVGIGKFEGKNTQIIDLKGMTMMPGFIESHGHLMALGASERKLDLTQVTSYEELVAKVKEAAGKADPGEWIEGWGWHQDKWTTKPAKQIKGFPTHQLLSEVSPENPVYLEHVSGHAAFVNARAMQLAGLNQLSVEKLTKNLGVGGEVLRDELENPTGILVEEAKNLVRNLIPKTTEERGAKDLTLAIAAALRNGITSFHDAGTTREEIELYKRFKAENKLDIRLYVMIETPNWAYLNEWYQHGPLIDSMNRLTIRAIKLHGDGALGSRGAWLTDPYSDRKDTYGMPTLSMDTVQKIAEDALRYGFQVCTHAIGDRANHEVLDRYEAAFRENRKQARDARFRIEHAQHLLLEDITRFGKLGVIASMQPIHLSSDRPWAIQRLGEKRIEEGAYMWQSLLASGVKVISGTDVPVEPINPIACFYAAVTRKTLQGEPAGGYEPKEKMTRTQALRSYTLDAAFGAFEESRKGSIVRGKLADFTIFSQDLIVVPEEDLLKTEVVMTWVGGKLTYVNPSRGMNTKKPGH